MTPIPFEWIQNLFLKFDLDDFQQSKRILANSLSILLNIEELRMKFSPSFKVKGFLPELSIIRRDV